MNLANWWISVSCAYERHQPHLWVVECGTVACVSCWLTVLHWKSVSWLDPETSSLCFNPRLLKERTNRLLTVDVLFCKCVSVCLHQVLVSDWAQAEASFHLCEVLFKVHKVQTLTNGFINRCQLLWMSFVCQLKWTWMYFPKSYSCLTVDTKRRNKHLRLAKMH